MVNAYNTVKIYLKFFLSEEFIALTEKREMKRLKYW